MLSKIILSACLLFSGQLMAANEQISLTTTNAIIFRGEVDGSSVLKAQMDLANLVNKRGTKGYKLYLVLDTPGGSIDDGEDFIQFAKTVPNLETVSIFAASMGSAIAEALPGRRLVTENGTLMFHRAAGGLRGQFEDGEMEVRLDFYKRLVRNMEQRSANRMGMSLVEYKKLVKDEFWTFGHESVANKSADAVVDLKCSKELIDSKTIVQMSFFFFTINVEYSNCPLIRVGKAVSNDDKEELKKAKTFAKAHAKDLESKYLMQVTN